MFPYLFSIGNFSLPTYGVLVAAAFLVALSISARVARQRNVDPDVVLNLGVYCALAGIAGAKLLMILADAGYYVRNMGELFSLATLQAGGIFYGGLIGALVVAYWYAKRQRLPLLRISDALVPGVAIGHAIGRLGCFAAGCCWGRECHLPWAVTFTSDEAHKLVGVPLGIPLHPSQLYESLAEFLIFGILFWRSKSASRDGVLLGIYLMLYATVRFFVEFVRSQEQAGWLGGFLTNAQGISLLLFGLGAALLLQRAPAVMRATPAR